MKKEGENGRKTGRQGPGKERSDCLREGTRKRLTTASDFIVLPSNPISKYCLLGNKTTPMSVPFVHGFKTSGSQDSSELWLVY